MIYVFLERGLFTALSNWKYSNLLTGYSVGMDMPRKLNPGPWVSKITFFEHFTGLIVTSLCVLTLFVMMQFTGRIDWEEVFKKGSFSKPARVNES